MQTDCWEGIDFVLIFPKEDVHMKVCQTGAWRGNIQEEGLPSQDRAWQVVFSYFLFSLFNFLQVIFYVLIFFWQVVFRGTWSGEQSFSLGSVEMMKSTIIATTVNYCSVKIWRKIKTICGPRSLPLEISGNPAEGILVTS